MTRRGARRTRDWLALLGFALTACGEEELPPVDDTQVACIRECQELPRGVPACIEECADGRPIPPGTCRLAEPVGPDASFGEWEDVTPEGLGAEAEIRVRAEGDAVYAALRHVGADRSGFYRLEGGQDWVRIKPADESPGNTAAEFDVASGWLFVVRDGLWAMPVTEEAAAADPLTAPAEGRAARLWPWREVTEGSGLGERVVGSLGARTMQPGRVHFVAEAEGAGFEFHAYDIAAGALSRVASPLEVDRIRQWTVDLEGRVWARAFDDMTYQWNGERWAPRNPTVSLRGEVSEPGGRISVGDDGEVYLSHEQAPTTQIGLFRRYRGDAYDRDEAWETVHSFQGYGTPAVALGDGSGAMVAMMARFRNEFILRGRRIYDLPSWRGALEDAYGGLYSGGDAQSDFMAAGGYLYIVLRYRYDADGDCAADRDDGEEVYRLLRIRPDFERWPFVTTDFPVTYATYLETSAPAEALDVELLADGRVVAAYNLVERDPEPQDRLAFVPRDGRLAIRSADGREALASLELPGEPLLDLDVDGDEVVIATTAGVYRVSAEDGARQPLLEHESGHKRVAVAGGWVASIVEHRRMQIFDPSGALVVEHTNGWSFTEDIELDPANERFYLVGFRNDDTAGGQPVQMPCVRAFDLTSAERLWSRFCRAGEEVTEGGRNIADGRLYRVHLDESGDLFVAGETAGSDSIFRTDGVDTETSILTNIDFYTALSNTASAHFTYHARLDAQTGAIGAAQFTMARQLSNGRSNTLRIRTGDLDAHGGRVVLGTTSTAFSWNREAQRINGQPLGPYGGGDPSLLILSPDFRTRWVWTTFIEGPIEYEGQSLGSGDLRGVAIRGDTLVALSSTRADLFTTEDAEIAERGPHASAVHLVWTSLAGVFR